MRGGVAFEAGGKARTLRFSVNAICAAEERTGRSLTDMMADMQGGRLRMTTLRDLFWAGLGQGVSPALAGELIDELGLDVVGTLLGQALELAMPRAADGDAGNALAAS